MGRPTKYTDEMIERAVHESASIAGVVRVLGITWSGVAHAHIDLGGTERQPEQLPLGAGRSRRPTGPSVDLAPRRPEGTSP